MTSTVRALPEPEDAVPEPIDRALLRRAARLAECGPAADPNPRVGAIVSRDGIVLGQGWHRVAGTPHAEVVALAEAGDAAAGAVAHVTLEPCAHRGRTPPCVRALLDAGIGKVVYAVADPTRAAGGGAATLRAAGVEVIGPVPGTAAHDLNPHWDFSVRHGRPFVTLKLATTLDGRVAAADRTSRWITGREARIDVHRRRATAGAIAVGTGTLIADDPSLTVRDEHDRPLPRQPLRLGVGTRELPTGLRARGPGFHQLSTHAPREVLEFLASEQVHHLWLEGGPTLAAAFVRAGLVDELLVYVAPMLLGTGPSSFGSLGIDTISAARRLRPLGRQPLGEDLLLSFTVPSASHLAATGGDPRPQAQQGDQ